MAPLTYAACILSTIQCERHRCHHHGHVTPTQARAPSVTAVNIMSSSNSRPASVAGYHADGVRRQGSPSVGPQHQHHDFVRPKSSASSHRPSSRATNRPPSSAGRPVSRLGNAPTSKPFHRLQQRQISRLISSSHSLVSQVTGLNADDDGGAFRATVDMVTRSLDYNVKAAPSSSMSDIAKLVNGFAFLRALLPLYSL